MATITGLSVPKKLVLTRGLRSLEGTERPHALRAPWVNLRHRSQALGSATTPRGHACSPLAPGGRGPAAWLPGDARLGGSAPPPRRTCPPGGASGPGCSLGQALSACALRPPLTALTCAPRPGREGGVSQAGRQAGGGRPERGEEEGGAALGRVIGAPWRSWELAATATGAAMALRRAKQVTARRPRQGSRGPARVPSGVCGGCGAPGPRRPRPCLAGRPTQRQTLRPSAGGRSPGRGEPGEPARGPAPRAPLSPDRARRGEALGPGATGGRPDPGHRHCSRGAHRRRPWRGPERTAPGTPWRHRGASRRGRAHAGRGALRLRAGRALGCVRLLLVGA